MMNRNTTPDELATAAVEFALARRHGTELSQREAYHRLRDVMDALYWPSIFGTADQPGAAHRTAMSEMVTKATEALKREGCCELCGEPMPAGEEMFKFHGYSGPCPTSTAVKSPPLPSRCACERPNIKMIMPSGRGWCITCDELRDAEPPA